MANANVAVGNGVDALDGGTGDDMLIAEPLFFSAPLQGLNNSGVSGEVRVGLTGRQMQVQVTATGLEAGQTHPMHIHGLMDDAAPLDSSVPPASADSDGDGFVELREGEPFYGPALLPLEPFSSAPGGAIAFEQSFDITSDLLPLTLREFVLQGASTGAIGAGTAGEVDGTAGYKATLPVAVAELQAQPLQTFAAQGTQGVTMSGGNGADRMIGGHGTDMMNGGNGADVLAGGEGDDDLVGGRGADRFVIDQGKDVVTDFSAVGGDRLVFAHGADLFLHDTNQGTWIIEGNGAITDPNSEGVLLLGVHADSGAEAAQWFSSP